MIKFIKEEISLCKQVAKRHRKEIARGDYYVGWRDKKNRQILALSHEVLTFESLIPLWTISDCLAFLQEREDVIELVITGKHLRWFCRWGNRKMRSGKTPLEACLKAILAVLEEGK